MGKEFNNAELDAIGEMMNISIGASATAISKLVNCPVTITTPLVSVQGKSEFHYKDLNPALAVDISYVKGLEGDNVLVFKQNDVRIIVGMMMGMEIPEEAFALDEITISAIQEVMNQMMGSSATALSTFLGISVDISTPTSNEIGSEQEFKDRYFDEESEKLVVRFDLGIEGKLTSQFVSMLSVELAERLLKLFSWKFGVKI